MAARALAATTKGQSCKRRRHPPLPKAITGQAALPAISNLSGARTMTLLLIEGNVIQGWVGEAIDLSAVRRDSDPIRFIVRNNSVEGAIRLTGLPSSYRELVTNNINLKTLEPVQPVLVPQEPAGK